MKNKTLKPIFLKPLTPKSILKRLKQRVVLGNRHTAKLPMIKKRKILRRLRKKLAIISIRRNR